MSWGSLFENKFLTRNAEAEDLIENFLVAAIVSVVATRVYLKLTGYPVLGGDYIRFSHMLLGGALMLLSILMLLSFLSKPTARLAAAIGGIGFGTFIDELGKFITHDNNYFFQPTIALIYLIFVLIYLLSHNVMKARLTSREYLINAIEVTKEAVHNDMDGHEKRRAIEFLEEADKKDPLVKAVRKVLDKVYLAPVKKAWPLTKIKHFFHVFYTKLIAHELFSKAIVSFFILHSLTSLVYTALLNFNFSAPSFIELGQLSSSTLSSAFIVIGLWKIKKSRVEAYRMFKRAVLVTIFLTHFFTFYQQQLTALTGLAWNILILITLRYMISEEEE